MLITKTVVFRKLAIILVTIHFGLFAVSCGEQDYARALPNQYELVRGDKYTVAIMMPDLNRNHPSHCEPGFAVSAKIVTIGIIDDIVVGLVEASPSSVMSPSECPGWFILDTNTDVAELGLSRNEWEQALKKQSISITDINLVTPKRLPDKLPIG